MFSKVYCRKHKYEQGQQEKGMRGDYPDRERILVQTVAHGQEGPINIFFFFSVQQEQK